MINNIQLTNYFYNRPKKNKKQTIYFIQDLEQCDAIGMRMMEEDAHVEIALLVSIPLMIFHLCRFHTQLAVVIPVQIQLRLAPLEKQKKQKTRSQTNITNFIIYNCYLHC